MCVLAVAIFAGFKWLTFWRARKTRHDAWRSLAYLCAWPGMDAERFLDPQAPARPPTLRQWTTAILEILSGAIVLWIVARNIPPSADLARGFVGILGLAFVIHFGAFQFLSLVYRRAGIDAEPLMAAPIRSASLSEFWGRRWNRAFRHLAYELIFRPLHRRFGTNLTGLLIFVVSGLIHDLVISVPARAGYGLPTTYFLIQGAGVALERSRLGKQLGLRAHITGWIFMAAVTAGPVALLFHPPFIRRVILPFMQAIHAL